MPPSDQAHPPLSLFRLGHASAPLVVWTIDAAGYYTLSEGKGLELLGMKPGEAVGLSALEMFRDNPAIANAFVRALAGEESHALTSPARGLHFRSWYAPLRGEDGQVCGATCVSVDVSEQVREEQDVRDELAVAERRGSSSRALTTPIIQVWDGVLCSPGHRDGRQRADRRDDAGAPREHRQGRARHAIVRPHRGRGRRQGRRPITSSSSFARHGCSVSRAFSCGIRPASVAQTIVGLGLDSRIREDDADASRRAQVGCIRSRADAPGPTDEPRAGGPQSSSIQEVRIPVIGLYGHLIVPIQGAVSDDVMAAVQDDVTQRIQRGGVRGLVIDVSGIEVLDSYLTRNLRDLALTARLMGVVAVVSGLRPAVAITLVEMGLEIPGVHTALNLERALEKLFRDPRGGGVTLASGAGRGDHA